MSRITNLNTRDRATYKHLREVFRQELYEVSQKQKTAWDRVIEPWWAKLTIGLLMIIFAVFQFNRYSRIESGEEKAPTIVIAREELAYDMGGKWLVSGISAVGGLGFLAWGGYQLSRKQRNAGH